MAYNALFDKREVPGERGGCGELTGPKHQGRKAVEAAWRELAAEVGGSAGLKLGCGGLGEKTSARWDREAVQAAIYEAGISWARRHHDVRGRGGLM